MASKNRPSYFTNCCPGPILESFKARVIFEALDLGQLCLLESLWTQVCQWGSPRLPCQGCVGSKMKGELRWWYWTCLPFVHCAWNPHSLWRDRFSFISCAMDMFTHHLLSLEIVTTISFRHPPLFLGQSFWFQSWLPFCAPLDLITSCGCMCMFWAPTSVPPVVCATNIHCLLLYSMHCAGCLRSTCVSIS